MTSSGYSGQQVVTLEEYQTQGKWPAHYIAGKADNHVAVDDVGTCECQAMSVEEGL